MKLCDTLLFVSTSLMVISLFVAGITDSPKYHNIEITDWLCSHNRLLCLKNLPQHNTQCEPQLPFKAATSRDVVIGMFVPKRGWTEQHLEMMSFVFYLMRQTIPKAHLVLFLAEQLKGVEVWDKMVQTYSIDAIYVNVPEGWNMVNYRFMLYKEYLKEHEGEIDRVIFCDSKDIYMLRDPFKQINNQNSLIIGREFRSSEDDDYYSYDGFYQYYNNYVWMKDAYGETFTKELKEKKAPINNAGFGGGDVHSMIKLLTIWTNEMVRIGGQQRWGFDQAVYNYLIYNGTISSQFPYAHFADCKHDRICMFSEKRVNLVKGIPYLFDGCIPHVLHRDGLSFNMMDVKRYPQNNFS
ncbi:hypothetical protein EHI8A_182460 [Entamoeba histolytica HM-1:IMSS-B]|uniref:Uncharacterized protein n=6 Tax=Entamoeba histolytica TaxID=5759 RepID=C4M3U0_ENTH1|nr:hypothetical protein EHI_163590 [Entamoeba histolytica HM-1:IMSS]EMD44927.1 Hypothetical protein EHI5A_182300 [Entamoeba histolytica KU27]EMH72518.1 hypothetical protein EHI8A_182460 [Entamoeba histolytica HM-1:IMSS-B]EMS13446.1 hypothetical protein KM1_252500 [Entamoeba histolytica HM-3:IMSS]ENY65425.1 hypothetical protein EHI7A_161260 [Entamoeba histolytica HM-1:IMSS-A]GAT96004.1 hypothetical protein CL6EHI_163590 [Entamoeba histolytica]|eukprot:XP_653719.1 hypothetical protein EHI_163590 [Entamoeba histolytica HM-1:IMSS]